MMKQIIKYVARTVGKHLAMHMQPAAGTENAKENALRHGLVRRTKIFRQNLKIFILGQKFSEKFYPRTKLF